MIRCAWCGAENYAIDSWCSSCSRHLDWSPPSRTAVPPTPPPPPVAAASAEPRRPPRRRRSIVLLPAAIVVGAVILLAMPVASWFSAGGGLRAALPGTASAMPGAPKPLLVGPAPRLAPGLYAVSASIVRGLPWRFYDSTSLRSPKLVWLSSWNMGADAFGYFRELTPVARVGRSIYVYELKEEDCARLARHWTGATVVK